MRLSIAQFASSLGFGGQERVIVDLAKAFHREGHKSLVCTTAFAGELVSELELSNIPFCCFELKKSYSPFNVISVVHYLKKDKVNVVITHGNYRFIPRIASIISKIPVIIHVEHNVSNYKKFYHIFINKILSMFTDKIVCISEVAKQSLLKMENPKIDKVVVIPNGLDIGRFSAITNKQKVQDGVKRVGIVGRFYEQKGHIYFVQAAAKIIQSFKNVVFIFIGDGPLRPMIEQKVREYGIEKYCYFLGIRSDVGELLQTFDVFVLSSLWEGMPISLLEAQYFGVASVVTAVGGNPEVIKDGYNGLLVPPKDSDALASAILRVINNDEFRYVLGQHAREVFYQNFTIEKMADKYIDLIFSILHSKGYFNKSTYCF
jgi:glycosyltransferase involved in cell wall biosynthesis